MSVMDGKLRVLYDRELYTCCVPEVRFVAFETGNDFDI